MSDKSIEVEAPAKSHRFTYRVLGGNTGHDGWWKWTCVRSDGKTVKLSRKRVAELRRQGRVTD